jgi:putative oxidoreductase
MTAHAATTGTKHQAGWALSATLWVVQVGAAVMFLMSAWPKLSGAPQMVAFFHAIGFGQWFRYLTGSMELAGAALILVPALSGVGALILFCVMVGALTTHALMGGSPVAAAVLLLAAAFVAWGRRDRTAQLLRRIRG